MDERGKTSTMFQAVPAQVMEGGVTSTSEGPSIGISWLSMVFLSGVMLGGTMRSLVVDGGGRASGDNAVRRRMRKWISRAAARAMGHGDLTDGGAGGVVGGVGGLEELDVKAEVEVVMATGRQRPSKKKETR